MSFRTKANTPIHQPPFFLNVANKHPRWFAIKDILWALYLYPALWISRTSWPFLTWLVRLAEPLFQIMTMPRKKEAEKNLSIAFGSNTSSHLIRTIARRFISNAVRRAADDLFLLRDDAEVRCRSFLGREHLDASLSAGRGVMLVSPHWYANRISNRYLATLGYPVMTVRNQEPPDRFIGRLGESSLQAQYIHLLHNVIRDEVFIQDPECTLKILRRLRKGGIVEMHLDAPFSRHLIMQSFLGQRVLMPAGPLHLIRTSGCAVLFKLAFGNADSLQIQIEPSVEIDNTLPIDTLCKSNLSALIKSMESHILEHPDQWELWTKL